MAALSELFGDDLQTPNRVVTLRYGWESDAGFVALVRDRVSGYLEATRLSPTFLKIDLDGGGSLTFRGLSPSAGRIDEVRITLGGQAGASATVTTDGNITKSFVLASDVADPVAAFVEGSAPSGGGLKGKAGPNAFRRWHALVMQEFRSGRAPTLKDAMKRAKKVWRA